MKISIYDTELNRIAIIDNHFVSVYWVEGFNSEGMFTLELQNQEEYKQKIKEDYYVGRADRKTLMVITSVEITKNKIIASGSTADRVFQDVAMIGTIRSTQYIDKRLKELYNNSEKIDNVEIAETDLGVKASMQISNRDFQTTAHTLAQKNNIGFRVVKGEGQVVGEFYLPKENNSVFAEKYGNLVLDRLATSNDNYKNYAVVLGEGEGENRERVDVDISNGQERKRQIVIDARDLFLQENETQEEYRERLRDRGIQRLTEHTKNKSVGIRVPAEEFGVAYDLGDRVTAILDDYGLKLQTNIARFSQKEQFNTITTIVEVGDIVFLRSSK